jgi:hypothetical protein
MPKRSTKALVEEESPAVAPSEPAVAKKAKKSAASSAAATASVEKHIMIEHCKSW